MNSMCPNKRAPGQRRLSGLIRFEHAWPGVPERDVRPLRAVSDITTYEPRR